jgi:hypothetical protein
MLVSALEVMANLALGCTIPPPDGALLTLSKRRKMGSYHVS